MNSQNDNKGKGHNHLAMMIFCCLVPLFLIAFLARFPIFRGGSNLLFFLLCPLMMIFMMFGYRSHDHSNHNGCKEEVVEDKQTKKEVVEDKQTKKEDI